jgi:hypothetical protein
MIFMMVMMGVTDDLNTADGYDDFNDLDRHC